MNIPNLFQFYIQNPLIGIGVMLRLVTLFVLLYKVLPVQYKECRLYSRKDRMANLCNLLTALIVSYIVTTIVPITLTACMPLTVCHATPIVDALSLINAVNTLIAGIIFYFIYTYKY